MMDRDLRLPLREVRILAPVDRHVPVSPLQQDPEESSGAGFAPLGLKIERVPSTAGRGKQVLPWMG